jgi:oxygen-independent coproporphyrinogen III oxidase
MKAAGLYIHIPFCLRKCLYCDFYSSTEVSAIPEFLKALVSEMDIYTSRFDLFDTIYVGGGTPSLLNAEQIEMIFGEVRRRFTVKGDAEITIEANPGDLHEDFLGLIRASGVNRINLGVQSFDKSVLSFLGRRHSAEAAIVAVEQAKAAGFPSVGLDLIYGIPGQGLTSWIRTLQQAIRLSPEHISCYQLSLEDRTPLGRRRARGELRMPGEELQYRFFMQTSGTLETSGYTHYEVSNFAKTFDCRSRHNQKYWDGTPYLGLGPAAHSFLDNRRWWNSDSLQHYVARLEAGSPPLKGSEELSMEQRRLEAFYLGLRTKKGLHIADFNRDYQCDLLAEKRDILAKLQEEGFVSSSDGYLYPTRKGLAVADSLCLL